MVLWKATCSIATARTSDRIAVGSNPKLVDYLRENPGYQVIQHGCHHDRMEFDRLGRLEAAQTDRAWNASS
jgi:hypothetical protein